MHLLQRLPKFKYDNLQEQKQHYLTNRSKNQQNSKVVVKILKEDGVDSDSPLFTPSCTHDVVSIHAFVTHMDSSNIFKSKESVNIGILMILQHWLYFALHVDANNNNNPFAYFPLNYNKEYLCRWYQEVMEGIVSIAKFGNKEGLRALVIICELISY